MARSKKDFTGAASGGIIPPAVERPALRGGGSTAKNQPVPAPRPKVVDPDRPNIIEDTRPIDEKELAISRRRYVQSGGTVSDTPNVSRVVTTPTDRNATSKEALAKLQEHHALINTFATTHSGAISTAARALPGSYKNHAAATKHIMSSSENLALAKNAFASRNSAKGNGHLQSAISSLMSAHKLLNSKDVREVTGTPLSIHPDELASWKDHISKLPAFRRQGKPFDRVQIGKATVRPDSSAASEVEQATKGTILGDKIQRARKGTPRTPKWERGDVSRPAKSEKGTGVINTSTRGTAYGTTGEMDPRRIGSKTNRIEQRLRRPNLPKIGDTTRKANKPMKPGDTVGK